MQSEPALTAPRPVPGASVTIEQGQADLSRVMANLAGAYPDTNKGNGSKVGSLKERLVGDLGPTLWMLLGAVGFVLLIACVNVSNLLLARSSARSREVAIRTALGAGRAELVRQFGSDHIIMGTDYPFDMADFDPIGHVASVEGFDPSTIAAIAGGNARKLLGI